MMMNSRTQTHKHTQLQSTLEHALHHSSLNDEELQEFLSGLQESVLSQLLETCVDQEAEESGMMPGPDRDDGQGPPSV